MNVDDSNNTTQSTVTSKYFTKNNDMDESLNDFKEKKKSAIGPKSTKTVNKGKSRKPKRIKGQKDIRTVLKQKNELVKYSEEFEDICKKSGVDVDADQLQLVIALSKSLQTVNEATTSESPKLNAQERKNNVRKTLQEYGFKVPEIKVSNKRVRKVRKEYKLLVKTDVEKRQITSDRYSQILMNDFEICNKQSLLNESIPLYNIATNACYNVLKDNHVYYVNDLIERSYTSGCLFKDYASIPGRPISPKLLDDTEMNFSEIECSQEELDVILSGAMNIAKKILKHKQSNRIVKVIQEDGDSMHAEKKFVGVEIGNCINIENVNHGVFKSNEDNMNCVDNKSQGNAVDSANDPLLIMTYNKQYRSCSPDIFDDEESILDNDGRMSDFENAQEPVQNNIEQNNFTKEIIKLKKDIFLVDAVKQLPLISKDINSGDVKPNTNGLNLITNMSMPILQVTENTKTKSDDFMDLTECIKSNNLLNSDKCSTQLPAGDTTKRKSNDLMELTECVNVKDIDYIDLTQNNHLGIDKEESNKCTENVDLTQSSNSNDELPFVCLNKSISLDTTVILDEKDYLVSNSKLIDNTIIDLSKCEHGKGNCSIFDSSGRSTEIKSNKITAPKKAEQVDLSQKSESINMNNLISSLNNPPKTYEERNLKTPTKFNEIFNTDIIPHCYEERSCKKSCPVHKELEIDLTKNYSPNKIESQSFKGDNANFDLTQSSDEEMSVSNKTDKFESNHTEIFIPRTDKCSKSDSTTLTDNFSYSIDDNCDTDLIQNAYESDISKTPLKSSRYSLGKKDDISVDYDEVYNINEEYRNTSNGCIAFYNDIQTEFSFENEQLEVYDNINSSNKESNCSQYSEVFEIYDNELDYSLNKSRHENFNIGGISVLNNLSKIVNQTVETVNDRVSYCNELTENCMQKNVNDIGKSTSEIVSNSATCIKTPGNNKYIIKTDKVTPMLNYATLSTPERNKELDKYGIKPLKRKRAIQLLTHLYNQTHPIVESSSDDIPSPSKKLCSLETRVKYQQKSHLESLEPEISSSYENSNKTSMSSKISPEISTITPLSNQSPYKSHSQYTTTPKKSTESSGVDSKSPGQDLKLSSKCIKSPRKCIKSPRKCIKSPRKCIKSPKKCSNSPNTSSKLPIYDEFSKENIYKVTTEVPCIKNIECEDDDMMFQKREKAKVHSCRLPLHIAFHNYVSSRKGLREAILRYEPVNIDIIHKELVKYGHRYDPKDLLKFMDKKCITVKTSDNNTRNDR